MPRPEPNSPRPEEATSWEEFRVASAAERAALGPSRSPTRARSQAALGVFFAFGALVFLAGAVVAAGLGMWVLILLAVFCGWVTGRYLPTAVRQGAFGTPRYWKIVLLGAIWRARAAGQQARTGAGQARTPAGQTRTPAGQTRTAAGQARTGAGQDRTGADQDRTAAAQARTGAGQARTPAGQTRTAAGHARASARQAGPAGPAGSAGPRRRELDA